MEFKYKTLAEAITGEGIPDERLGLSESGASMLTVVQNLSIIDKKLLNGEELNDFEETLLDNTNGFYASIDAGESLLYSIMLKRLSVIDIGDVPKSILLFIEVFEIYTPSTVVLFVVTLMDIYHKLNEDKTTLVNITVEDVIKHYIDGFYVQETLSAAIQRILKPKLCENSYIY